MTDSECPPKPWKIILTWSEIIELQFKCLNEIRIFLLTQDLVFISDKVIILIQIKLLTYNLTRCKFKMSGFKLSTILINYIYIYINMKFNDINKLIILGTILYAYYIPLYKSTISINGINYIFIRIKYFNILRLKLISILPHTNFTLIENEKL